MRLRTFAALCLAALPLASPAAAHPHSWIDLSVAVKFDGEGRVAGLDETWLFDETYTVYIVESFLKKHAFPKPDQGLKPIAERIMRNLHDYSYFTRARAGGEEAEIAEVSDADAKMRGRRLELRFTAHFRTPAAADGFSYAVYDPTYYIEILHAEGGEPIRLDGAPATCGFRLAKPNPSIDAVALASALDQTQSADDTLGELFAEKVMISCH